ncbi:MAG TPA: hypothetical protein VHO48_15595, partial [Anaerolineaceae bacterium]|nr:hypothetical protein [Anaerolineaceae bacterium]
EDYWETFEVRDSDLEFIYNQLLELETPQTTLELTRAIVQHRIENEKQILEKQQQAGGAFYLPKGEYQAGQTLMFPALDWKKGTVTAVRPGSNPDLAEFDVIQVAMESGEKREFAARLENHPLNQPISMRADDPALDVDQVMKDHGEEIEACLTDALELNSDLVRIAGRWFPRALLVDVGIGYLNLAEAVLEMEGGGPMPTRSLLEQVDLPTDTNPKLTEFSFNLALQEDDRFDEVGPAGEVLWFLQRMEPETVRDVPNLLRYKGNSIDTASAREALQSLDMVVADELEPSVAGGSVEGDEIKLALIYPHWRAGTLPLSNKIIRFFPTAYESPRVKFTFVDGDTGEKIDGWVIRQNRYAFGLRDWYLAKGLIPGSIVHIRRSKNPGEVIVQVDKQRRATREWIRTVLIGADGGIVFAMLKQMITAGFDERLATAISDQAALDSMWESGSKQRGNLESTVMTMMRELGKLNPQGHVHAQELYAAVNIVRRCPPGPILTMLVEQPWSAHLGDLYFRYNSDQEEKHD